MIRHSIHFAAGLFLCLLAATPVQSQQGVVPSKGKEFWLGFMQNYTGAQTLDIFISSDVNTTGTVEMPLTGWSQPFTVTANVTTTVSVPVAMAEHTGSEIVDNKSVLVQTNDTVSVFAINFQSYTADGTQVFPIQSLGIDYRIHSYEGLGGWNPSYNSEFLIVATKDDTQVEITPTTPTLGGRPAGVPFIVDLDSGQTYQVQAATAADDLSGSTIRGTDSSGVCRPFAVFSGVMCVNVPQGCTACDHICTQNLPTNVWGTQYFSVPFNSTTSYTYRILADQNGTSVTVNGGAPIPMNAGQVVEVNNFAGAACFESNLPISVAQYMQGASCSRNGDPALLILNAADQSIDNVTFATVVSTVITTHFLNVVIETANIPSLSLDGAPVAPALFTNFPACPTHSWASFPITAGSHTLDCPDGFTAYAYGTGGYESYAYSVGSFSPLPPINLDSVLCTSDTLTLAAPANLSNIFWTTTTNPTDTLAWGPTYTFVPTVSDIYVATGFQFVSGCEEIYYYSVEIPDPPVLTLTASDNNVCAYTEVQLDVTVTPPSGVYSYTWSPSTDLDDPNIANPVATPAQSTWYTVAVSTPSGCGQAIDSIQITVTGGDVLNYDAETQVPALCLGDSSQLTTTVQQIIEEDDFDPAPGALWSALNNGSAGSQCGSVTGNALYFDGPGVRSAETVALDVTPGGVVRFALKIGTGAAPCENADPGDDVVLEYSTGGPWTLIDTYWESLYPTFTTIDAVIPAGAQTANTQFRWRQLNNGGAGEDNWSLDNVVIAINDDTDIQFTWSPAAQVSDPNAADPMAYPTGAGWFTVQMLDLQSGCDYVDSVFIDVDLPFTIAVTPDTAICDVAGIQLNAVPSSGSNHTWLWTPGGSLNADFVQDPVATPAATTTYLVTVTTGFGCQATDSVTVTVAGALGVNATAAPTQLCVGDSTLLNAQITQGATTNLAFSWSSPGSVNDPLAQSSWANPVQNTNYIVTVTDTITGCVLVDSVQVNVTNLYGTTVTPDTTVCSAIGLQLEVQHNVPNPFISWTPANYLAGANTATPTITFDSTAQYIVQIDDGFGCAAFDTVNVTVAFSGLTFFADSSLCAGDSMLIDAGFPDAQHVWNTGATTQTITVGTAGNYTVTMTDSLGCQSSFTTTVTVDALPVVQLGPDTSLCIGQVWTLDAGNPGSQYLWNTSETTQTINVTTDSTYAVQVTDQNDCVQSDSILVTFDPLPVIQLSDTIVCVSETITLDAGNPGSYYLWSTSETTQTIDVAVNSGTYSVVVTTPTICIDSANATLTFIPFPVVDLGPDTALCDTEQITLDAGNPGETFNWHNGSTAQTVTLTDDAEAWVSVFNGYCTTWDTVQVVFNPLPIPVLAEAVTTCLDFPPHYLPLDAGNPDCAFDWSSGENTQVVLADAYGLYVVTITTPLNCSIEDQVLVEEYCPSTLYVPNSFTPDGDGVNDIFYPMGNNLAAVELNIFDRWGELIYTGEDADAFWNGELNGNPVQDGVYVWKVKYRFFEDVEGTLGPEFEDMGHVTLLR